MSFSAGPQGWNDAVDDDPLCFHNRRDEEGRLVISPDFLRFVRFCVVGGSGVAVNMGVLIALTEGLAISYILSSLVAIEVSILSNFALNNAWTWRDRRSAPLGQRLLKYHAVAGLTALVANWCLLLILTRFFGMDYRIANFIGIAAGVALNFVVNHAWTFGGSENNVLPCVSPTVGPRDNPPPASGTHGSTLREMPSCALLWITISVVVVLTAAKVYFASQAELIPEEAYYWTYWQHPALGYFDHPPMVAWIIGIGTFFLGDTELGVRLGTILLSLGSSAWMFLIARLWFGQTCACWSVLLLNALPIFVGGGVLAFPDGPLVFFWLLTLWAISKALGISATKSPDAAETAPNTHATLYWLLAGLGFGGALLSKYTAIMLGASLALFLATSRTHRYWFARPGPWMAVIMALFTFSPVIIWNAQHEWASFLFQSTRTVGQRPEVVKNVSTFWLVQIGILGPLPFALLATAAWQAAKRGWGMCEDRWNFAASFFFPLFAIFVLASFKTEVRVNWTAPTFLSLILAAAAILQEGLVGKSRMPALRWRQSCSVAAVFVITAVSLAMTANMWGRPSSLAYSRFGGWQQIAASVNTATTELAGATGQKPFVLGVDKYNIAAELSFYTHEPENQVNTLALGKHGLGFRYWTELNSFEGRPAVAVLSKIDKALLSELTNYFNQVDPPKSFKTSTMGFRPRTMWLVNCHGYRTKPRQDKAAH